MLGFISFVWRQNRAVFLLTIAALCTVIYFAVDFAAEAIHFADPANQNRTIEPWMSIRYVEQSWGLTKPVMFEVIGYDPETPPSEVPRSVYDYLVESGMTIEQFQAAVQSAQAEHQAGARQ